MTKIIHGIVAIIVVIAVLGVFALFLNTTLEPKIIDKQKIQTTIKNKISLQAESAINSYHDCIVVTSDYMQYRVWALTANRIEDLCNNLPINKPVELTLTKFEDSEGRYDVTDYLPKRGTYNEEL